ncbi:hypothetical protein QZH41_007136 [Actinostola sp. cb2023]|nr:hypothetical protein QZH41_007136 [Actinostola sp. cb2023]
MKVTLPIFKRRALTYIQWTPTTNDSALDLHYQSLNIPPPLKINKTILNALDQTFHRIDGNIITKLQKTGFGSCPSSMKVTLPIFKRRALTYIQWTPTTNDSALDLHYQSLNIPPPLKINKTILNALDQTFHRIDGNIITKLQKIADLHWMTPQKTTNLNYNYK